MKNKIPVFLATKNKGKIEEFKKLVEGLNIDVKSILDNIDIPDVKEDFETFEENSQKKALEISKYLDIITISDDSGLCVDALNGKPGIYSARYAGEEGNSEKNMEKLLSEMDGMINRDAKFVSVVSIAYPDGNVYSFRGEVSGYILNEKDGNNGFGYDPIFFSSDLNKSFGVATIDEKKSVSHRGKAFQKLKEEILNIF